VSRAVRTGALGGLIGLVLLLAACARAVAPLPVVPAASPTPPPPIDLPRDAGPHDALTEWWYVTGHLQDAAGRAYGFEFTIFQVRRQDAPAGYLAHFAVSDVTGQRFSHQAHARQGEPLAGFPLDVDGWTLATDAAGDLIDAAMQPGPGADPPFRLHLRLQDQKPPVLHHGGYLDLGPGGGSYYYSRPRLGVTGELQAADGPAQAVSGQAWMDHQWGNFVITSRVVWDWYSLQLDDRTELMLYVLRGPDEAASAVYGTYVLADGRGQDLAPGSVQVRATGSWSSPHTGATYPSGWQLTLPDGRVLRLESQLADQELYFPAAQVATPAYWEGAVTITGDATGEGYVELTGYARGKGE